MMRFPRFQAAAVLALVACGSGSNDQQQPPPLPKTVARAPKPTPDTVTTASPKKVDGPAVVVADPDKVDGAALRARTRARLAADRSPVTVLTGGTAFELGRRLCEQVVPKRPAATPVLIKPNMSGFNWFRNPKTGDNGVTGRTTDPEFVRGIVRCVKARGHTKITVADGFTGKPSDWQRLIKVSGYGAMAAAEKVDLVALDDDGVFDVEGAKPGKPLAISGLEKTRVPTLLMPKGLADHLAHGLYISAPKIKTHRYSVFSLGIKSMQGTAMYSDASPAYQQKWRTHREIAKALQLVKAKDPGARALYVKSLEVFAERMVDILELEAPDVVLAEGAPAMTGDGFDKLYPNAEPVAIGGTNVITVDRVGAQYLGLWANAALAAELGGHATSPLLEVAAKRFGIDLANPKIVGDGAALFATPRPAYLIGMAEFEVGAPPAEAPGELLDPKTLPTELHASPVTDAPVIDGAIDDAWSKAPVLTFVTDWAGRGTKTTTRVRALWSATGLHLLFELDNITPFTDRTRPVDIERIDLYEENCVELFLALDPANRDRYVEIEVGPFGHFFDILVDRNAKPRADHSWSAGLRIGTTRDDARNAAVIEIAIESPDVLRALTASARLPIGVYRMEGKLRRQYLAAFPTRTPKPSFHVPSAFGTLVLDP
ncbi:MAG: DUF362 domain-containing protein [Deltaproteobacteria bacterium]|nr:DUF362 domain-containing protein [Deltaproteobacteria bacterium]